MTTKTVYQTSHLGLYVGPVEADESPLEPGVFLLPAGCVETPPPPAPEFKVACWISPDWHLLDYYEGLVVYNVQTREPKTIDQVGPLPNGYTLKKPAPHQMWKNGQWVDDLHAVLTSLHAAKLVGFEQQHQAHLKAGLTSAALGTPHRYSSHVADRISLLELVTANMEADYLCHDEHQEHRYRPHTSEQLRQVVGDQALASQAAALQLDRLQRAADQAVADQDLPALRALEWSVPT